MSDERVPSAALARRPANLAARPAGVVIRAAELADVDALVALECAAFATDRLSRRSLARFAASPSACLLAACAEDDRRGNLAGYALVLIRRGSRQARLYSLAVAPARAGQGLGARLVAAAEDAARIRGATALSLEVRADNPRADSLYRRMGYRQVKLLPDYYADGATGRRYRRALLPPAPAATLAAPGVAAQRQAA